MTRKNFHIGEQIRELRVRDQLSQEDLARVLSIPRSAVSQIESGERAVSSDELRKCACHFEVTADYLLGMENPPEIILEHKSDTPSSVQEIRISVPEAQLQKFKEVILYILEKCAGKPNIGQTALYKLLYFADFNFYEKYEEFLTGAQYRKLPYGPVPYEFQAIADEMIQQGELTIGQESFHNYPQKRFLPLRKSNLSLFGAHEKEVLDQVIDQLSDRNAKWLSDYSHEDIPWKATGDKDVIDYELVFYRTSPYSVRDYADEGEGEE